MRGNPPKANDMRFKAEIDIMPRKELLDPQGKTVAQSAGQLGIPGIQSVRIGKHISMEVEADSQEDARQQVEDACHKLLANLIMEQYEITRLEALA